MAMDGLSCNQTLSPYMLPAAQTHQTFSSMLENGNEGLLMTGVRVSGATTVSELTISTVATAGGEACGWRQS